MTKPYKSCFSTPFSDIRIEGNEMNTKNTIVLLGIALLMAGVVFAISGASFNEIDEDRWTGATAGTHSTEGGNVTQGDIGSASLTDRWAAYFGNVSGSIVLGNDSVQVYTWSVTNASAAGEVCASVGGDFAFASAATETRADIDTAFGLGAAADNAAGTFTDASACDLTFDVATVASSTMVAHEDSNFWTCAINDGGGNNEGDIAFCTNISSSGETAYDGTTPAQYELMVATTPGSATFETYNFYLELN